MVRGIDILVYVQILHTFYQNRFLSLILNHASSQDLFSPK